MNTHIPMKTMGELEAELSQVEGQINRELPRLIRTLETAEAVMAGRLREDLLGNWFNGALLHEFGTLSTRFVRRMTLLEAIQIVKEGAGK